MTAMEQSRTPTLAEVLRLAIRQAQGDLHVSLPGRIESYDASEQKADIKPLLMRPLVAADGTELDPEILPKLMDVPIIFPRGGAGTGSFFLSWPLEPGDLVHLIFVEKSIDQWLGKDGEDTAPLVFRMHDLSDAVAYPGLYPRRRSIADAHVANMVLGEDGGSQIHIKPNSGEIHIGSENAAEFVALAQKTFDELDAIRSTLNDLVTAYNGHIHITTATVGAGPTLGIISPTTSSGTAPATVNSVAATTVKAD